MHRIDGVGAVNNMFAEGDPSVPQMATRVTSGWLNDVQENLILCDSLTVRNSATLHMTGKGCRVTADDPLTPFVDFRIPFKVGLDSSHMSLAQALAVIKFQGLAPWDSGTFQHYVAALYGFNLSVSLAGALALLSAAGCALGANGLYNTGGPGSVGNAGSNGGMGGGGSGGCGGSCTSHKAGKANPYCGGCGGAGSNSAAPLCMISNATVRGGNAGTANDPTFASRDVLETASLTAGAAYAGGGGAGNPGGFGGYLGANGGDGCGGKLVIIARTGVTVQSGGKIEASGVAGGAGGTAEGGGGSGGGHVSIISPSAISNAGTIQAAGGAGGAGTAAVGGAGGAGSVVTKLFSDMGW